MEYEDDTVRSMLGLEAGQTYTDWGAGYALARFPRWQCGRKEEVLEDGDADKKRWRNIDSDKLGRLDLEQTGEPVVFAVLG